MNTHMMEGLKDRYQRIEALLRMEERRSHPGSFAVQHLKREKQALLDQLYLAEAGLIPAMARA